MRDAPHALIAGAGIGGLTAALFLRRAGFRVSLLERAPCIEEVGAGLQLSPNASAPLRALGVLPLLAKAALAPEALRVRRARDGALLHLLPLKDAEARWGAPYLLVHRADLQNALVASVAHEPEIAFSMQTELMSFAATKENVVATARRDGREITLSGDFLIGADGLRSIVRQRFAAPGGGHAASRNLLPPMTNFVAWRALVAADTVAPTLRRPETTLWLGPHAHLVHYPLRAASVINVVAVVEMPIAIDGVSDPWSQRGDAAEIGARFLRWHDEARALIAAAREWRRWPLVDLPPLPTFARGRVALLGDAAHPMLPFLAQGAAQAIEDAAVLGRLLSPEGGIEEMLAAYSAARQPRANRIKVKSRRQAWIYHMTGPATLLRDFALKKVGVKRMLARQDWLYDASPN